MDINKLKKYEHETLSIVGVANMILKWEEDIKEFTKEDRDLKTTEESEDE